MSIDGIGSGVLRELFALIGRNIAGEPPPLPSTVPAAHYAPAVPPRPAGAADLPIAAVESDAGFSASVSLAGLRSPAPLAEDAAAARAALRLALARLAAAAATLPSAAAAGSLPATEGGAFALSGMSPSDMSTSPTPMLASADMSLSPAASADDDAARSWLSPPSDEAAGAARGVGDAASQRREGSALSDALRAAVFGAPSEAGGPEAGGREASAFAAAIGEDGASLAARHASAPALRSAAAAEDGARAPFADAAAEGGAANQAHAAQAAAASADPLDFRLAVFDLALALDHLADAGPAAEDPASAAFFAAAGAPLQAERAGVIASFILNAAMIPGWPPPRPIEGVPVAVAQFVNAQKELTEAERDLLLQLGKLLHSPETLGRLLRKAKAAAKRAKLLAALDFILTVVDELAGMVADELARLEDFVREDRSGGARQKLTLR